MTDPVNEEMDKIMNRTAKDEIILILRYCLKFMIITLIISSAFFLFSVLFLHHQQSTIEDYIYSLLQAWSGLNVALGFLIFIFFSSAGHGFDAVWSPGLQRDIQRDERKRQLKGWNKAMGGVLLSLTGFIINFIGYHLFVN